MTLISAFFLYFVVQVLCEYFFDRFIYHIQSKTQLSCCSVQMATVISNRQNLIQPKNDHHLPKNILKNKPTNQTNNSKPTQKHNASEEKQFKPIMRRSIEKPEIEENNLLAQKKGIRGEGQQQNNLRNIIQTHEEDYKQPKPFHKKYGTQNTTQTKNLPAPQSRQQKQQAKTVHPTVQQKNKTKQSFNKKLNNNIIKDEETPTSKQSYRIKKIDNRSPKKIRDDLIVLNQEEHKLQMEILEIHKSTKKQLDQYKSTYKFNMDNIKKYFPQLNQGIEEITIDQMLQHIGEKIRHKKKQLNKIQSKIQGNAYIVYLKNLPQDIMEMHSSEEQDEVQELADNRPRLQNNIGSYASSMPGIKDKKYALNLRRTYDIFKQDDKQSRITHQEQAQNNHQQQKIKDDGQNKMTVNSKLKDFLLS